MEEVEEEEEKKAVETAEQMPEMNVCHHQNPDISY